MAERGVKSFLLDIFGELELGGIAVILGKGGRVLLTTKWASLFICLSILVYEGTRDVGLFFLIPAIPF